MQSAAFVPFEEASLSWDAKCIRRTLHRSSQFPCLPLPPSSRSPFSSSSSSFFPFLPLQRKKDKSITPRALSRVNGNSMEKWLSGRALSILSCRYHLTSYSLARFLATKCEKERPFLSVPINERFPTGVSRFPSDMACTIITWTHSWTKERFPLSFVCLSTRRSLSTCFASIFL